jgi:creatinine amidohydrolase
VKTIVSLFAALILFCFPTFIYAEKTPLVQIHIKDMNWLDIRGTINCGFTTVIVPTGGIEQNGLQMVLAKHDYIVGFAATKIARELGNTLVAPVISFVPQGNYEPPTGNMQFPGTIGVQEHTFELLLDDIARSLKNAGFKRILFIGDHGQSQAAQLKIAEKLTSEWRKDGIQVQHIASYYDDKPQYQMLEKMGETLKTIGVHAGLIDTSELMFVNPSTVNLARVTKQPENISILGSSGKPEYSSADLGQKLLDLRVKAAINEIKSTHHK